MKKGFKMRIKIENFAKIKKADIEINGITLLAGENNTGKSTVGKVLSCMFSTFNNIDSKVHQEKLKGIMDSIFKRARRTAFNNYNEVYDFSESISNLQDVNKELIFEKLLDINFLKESDILEELSENILTHLEYEDENLKGLIIEKVFKSEFKNQICPNNIEVKNLVELTVGGKKIEVVFDADKVSFDQEVNLYNDGIYIDDPFILDDLTKQRRFNKFDFYFERNSLTNRNNLLLNKLERSIENDDNSLIDKEINKGRANKFLKKIKHTISGDFVEKEDKFMFSDKHSSSEIELKNLSTGIKSFAILLKLLEGGYIIDKTVIILDEPEIHLHPKWQLIYAEILILLQKEFDLTILITSHSPYFIAAIEYYSANYEISDLCKYYLADLNDKRVVFTDVTLDTSSIYEKLAEPLNKLEELIYEKNN